MAVPKEVHAFANGSHGLSHNALTRCDLSLLCHKGTPSSAEATKVNNTWQQSSLTGKVTPFRSSCASNRWRLEKLFWHVGSRLRVPYGMQMHSA